MLGPVAQWIEQVGSNDKVGGSTPSRVTASNAVSREDAFESKTN